MSDAGGHETFRSGGRIASVRVPTGDPELVVFPADGQRTCGGTPCSRGGLPTSARPRGRDGTAADHSPVFDPGRFAAHEEFFVHGCGTGSDRASASAWRARVRPCSAHPPGGSSPALGIRHPQLFDAIPAASPGAGYRPDGSETAPLPRTSLVAGADEPFFPENVIRWADALRSPGAEVELRERPGGHHDAIWRAEFPRMVSWAARG